ASACAASFNGFAIAIPLLCKLTDGRLWYAIGETAGDFGIVGWCPFGLLFELQSRFCMGQHAVCNTADFCCWVCDTASRQYSNVGQILHVYVWVDTASERNGFGFGCLFRLFVGVYLIHAALTGLAVGVQLGVSHGF